MQDALERGTARPLRPIERDELSDWAPVDADPDSLPGFDASEDVDRMKAELACGHVGHAGQCCNSDEHVDEIVVAEDEHAVVVFATVCTPVSGERGELYEGPWHVYLKRPLGGRPVIDGTRGTEVAYKNIWAELEKEARPRARR